MVRDVYSLRLCLRQIHLPRGGRLGTRGSRGVVAKGSPCGSAPALAGERAFLRIGPSPSPAVTPLPE